MDWSCFLKGDPTYDIDITQLICKVVAPSLFPKINRVNLFNRYYDYYQRECPIDPVRVEYYEAFRCLAALLEGTEDHSAWGLPETMRRLSEHFEKITSVRLALPKAIM